MNITILILFIAVILLLIFTNWHIFHLKRFTKNTFDLPSVIDVVGFDLQTSIKLVKKALGKNKKGSAFPLKIQLAFNINGSESQPIYNSWTSNKMIPEIIGSLLEREGWVVYKTPDCKIHEIVVDLPRSTLQKT